MKVWGERGLCYRAMSISWHPPLWDSYPLGFRYHMHDTTVGLEIGKDKVLTG